MCSSAKRENLNDPSYHVNVHRITHLYHKNNSRKATLKYNENLTRASRSNTGTSRSLGCHCKNAESQESEKSTQLVRNETSRSSVRKVRRQEQSSLVQFQNTHHEQLHRFRMRCSSQSELSHETRTIQVVVSESNI